MLILTYQNDYNSENADDDYYHNKEGILTIGFDTISSYNIVKTIILQV
jgi:hypothetical protein